MPELQAAIEFQVELGKFYNVDLFQRGYYQIRTSMKLSPKVTAKIDVSLQKETDSRLILPGSVVNGVAISKTFQILYRREDIDINNVIAFKIYMLVDMFKIEEIIADADFQLNVELWFTEEDISPTLQEKLQCLSQRTLKLHFMATRGIHHYVPLLFDYFHLSAVCLTIHGTLIALHQPYICVSRSHPRASAKIDQTSESSAVFSSSSIASTSSRNSSVPSRNRKQAACLRHRRLCQVLLSAYESLQTSFENLMMQLHNRVEMKLDHIDCRSKLEDFCKKCEVFASSAEEEDLFQAIQSDLATLCSQTVAIWLQYLEFVTQNDAVIYHLAKEHHTLRVKRFSEGFFLNEYQKQEVIACFDAEIHGHADMATVIRESTYFKSIPSLAVECVEVDGDAATVPIIFEDIYSEPVLANVVRFRSESGSKSSNQRSNRESCYSNASATSVESSSSITRKSSRLKFIQNMRPESLKRPSSYMKVENQVAIDSVDCTLVGYRKRDHLNAVPSPPVELGTLGTSGVVPSPLTLVCGAGLYNAASLPTLPVHGCNAVNCSSSLPDLANKSSVRRGPAWNRYSTVSDKPSSDPSSSSSNLDVQGSRDGSDCPNKAVALELCNGDEGLLRNADSASKGRTEVKQNSSLADDDRSASQEIFEDKKASFGLTVLDCEKEQSLVGLASDGFDPSCAFEEYEISETIDRNSVVVGAGEKPIEKNEAVAAADSSGDRLVVAKLDLDNILENEGNEGAFNTSQKVNKCHDNDDDDVNSESKSDRDIHSATEPKVSPSQASLESGKNVVMTPCTALELIQEEYARNRSEIETSDSSLLVGVNSTAKNKELPKRDPEESNVDVADGAEVKSGAKSGSATNSNSERPQKLVDEVTDKIVGFISAKETLRKELDLHEHFYSDFPSQISSLPYFTPPEKFFPLPDEGIHLIVCVHGLDGNSTDLRLVRTYLELALPGNKIEFLMSERNQGDTFADFEVMTDRLVQEILYHIDLYSMKPSRISFIGHSLGNLIIRSAMSRPQMTELLPKLHTFLSLSGPHLGTLFNSSGLVNMGMWLMQKWKKSGSLLQLSLKDHQDPRQTFLYRLSQKTGLEFFRNILLVGSQQDRYVPFHSSRIELCKAALRDASGWGAVYTEMVNNILQPIIYKSDINFIRYDVFHALSGTTNHLIGRAAHIAVLDSELFIEKFINVAALKHFV